MAKLETLGGYGVLALAIAMLAAFTLSLSNPPADVLRAAGAPRAITVLPEIAIPSTP